MLKVLQQIFGFWPSKDGPLHIIYDSCQIHIHEQVLYIAM